jgi:hypothetical protein
MDIGGVVVNAPALLARTWQRARSHDGGDTSKVTQ